jgi:PPIC-type PPIASE domain
MVAFLTIDGEPLSVDRCRRLLHAAGHLGGVIGTLLRQYVLERELARAAFTVKAAWIDLAIADFCARHALADRAALDEWLAAHGDDHAAFTARLADDFRTEQLRHAVTTPRLAAYFEERRPFLDRVLLSRTTADDEAAAAALRADAGDGLELEPLAAIDRADLPAPLRKAVAAARPGEVIGPFPSAGRWAIYRVDEHRPASLTDPALTRALRDELFERWLGEQIELLTVELPG